MLEPPENSSICHKCSKGRPVAAIRPCLLSRTGQGHPWISSFPRNNGHFRATARTFARDEMMPHARDWDEDEIFPVESLRKAAALGFGGIYVKEDVGGSALSRLDAALIFEELGARLHLHRGLYLDPQHGGVDDRCLRQHGGAQEISSQALHDGAFRKLLPDRAGRRIGCGKPEHARAGATASTTCSTVQRRSSPVAAFPTSMS